MRQIEKAWQNRGTLACLLWPVSLLYSAITSLRSMAYRRGWRKVHPVPLPVIVVGNLSIGGTGKTPLCAHLVHLFEQRGWQPGIVSRGYGGERHIQPYLIKESDTATSVGDEPLMLFRQTRAPVCVCIDRAKAVEHLAASTTVDIVFSDDGLQHLAMPRVAQVIVFDGQRGLGNGWLLPAGPLRQTLSHLASTQLASTDVIAIQTRHDTLSMDVRDSLNGNPASEYTHKPRLQNRLIEALTLLKPSKVITASGDRNTSGQTSVMGQILHNTFSLQLSEAVCLATGKRQPLSSFAGTPVVAMAGIGNPQRFFNALESIGLQIIPVIKPDHHVYQLQDLLFDQDGPVLVTSKDAVKLRALPLNPAQLFEVPATLQLSPSLYQCVVQLERDMRSLPQPS